MASLGGGAAGPIPGMRVSRTPLVSRFRGQRHCHIESASASQQTACPGPLPGSALLPFTRVLQAAFGTLSCPVLSSWLVLGIPSHLERDQVETHIGFLVLRTAGPGVCFPYTHEIKVPTSRS